MIFLDTETKTKQVEEQVRHRMKMGWSCYLQKREGKRKDTETWKYWIDTEKLNQYLESKAKQKTVLYIFGHNIFFDLQAGDFFHYFTKWGWILDFIYDKGLTYILKIHKDKRIIVVLSTTNYYPVSLKVLGDIVGIPKGEVDFDKSTEDELITYCRQDVEIIKNTVQKWIRFLDLHDLGNFSYTKAGQAFKAFRHRFMDTKINIHAETDVIELEKNAYLGGRVECYQLGKIKQGPFVSLDINSMYPFVMKTKQYPTKLVDHIQNPTVADIQWILRKWLVVAQVHLETDEPAYAIRRNGHVIFPIGDFPAFLCSQGLEYAIEHGHLKSVQQAAVYDKANVFNSYVDYFYDLKNKYKAEHDPTMTMISKHFLNNLYGKFAQNSPIIEEEEDITFDGYYRHEIFDAVTGKKEIETKLFNKRFIEWGDEPSNTSFAAIAAHVTEYARMYLWQIMKDAGLNHMLYCDTDSIKLRQRHLKHISDGLSDTKLGALKLEETAKTLSIYAPKDYETESHKVLKGIPASAVKISETEYSFDYFPKQSSHLRAEITRFFITRPMVKKLKREYKKGIVTGSGKVLPFRLKHGKRLH